MEQDTQEHILRGGLILGEFGNAECLQETDDVREIIDSGDYDRWLAYVFAAYKPDHSVWSRIVGSE